MFNYADLRSYLNYAEPEVTNAAQPGSTFVDDVITQQAPRLAQDSLGLQSAQPSREDRANNLGYTPLDFDESFKQVGNIFGDEIAEDQWRGVV